jgi:hypothetical protein
LHRDLSRALPRQTLYEISHISSFYYLLMLNSHITDKDFKVCFDKGHSPLGYISFPWFPAIKSKEHDLGYKLWLDLVELSPHTWALDDLAVLTSSFGLILAHSLLSQVSSFKRLRLSIVTDNLSQVPICIHLFLNGRLSSIPVVVLGWIRESTEFEVHIDPTPSEVIYENTTIDLYDRMKIDKMRRSPSTSPGRFLDSYLADCPDIEKLDNTSSELSPASITIERCLLLGLCAMVSAYTAK